MTDAVARLQALLRQWEPAQAEAIEQQAHRMVARLEERLQGLNPPGWEVSQGIVLAAGGLVWQGSEPDRRVAIIHRSRYDDWSLPKGKLEHGEPPSLGARREVWEETACHALPTAFAGLLHYTARRRPKLVFFWHMAATGFDRFHPSEEVDQVAWLPVAEALQRLSYPIERNLLSSRADNQGS